MCGLIGVTGTSESAFEVFLGLMNLQHRGQDGAGILALDSKENQFSLQKGSGLVENVFAERSFRSLKGPAAIGHSRYATIGKRDPNLLQPFLDSEIGLGIGHNGNIVNCYQLRHNLTNIGLSSTGLANNGANIKFATESDSEVILKLLASFLSDALITQDKVFEAISKVMTLLVGSYAVIGLLKDGSMFGFRDPDGIRPLVLGRKLVSHDGGKTEYAYAMSSETVALSYLGYEICREVAPGQAVFVSAAGEVTEKVLQERSYSACMFEWVYFARVESAMGNMQVYRARFLLGTILAQEIKKRKIQADVVLPVPETSRIAAIALAESLGLPFRELLIKNRYVNRTFIMEDERTRQEAIQRKLYPIASEIRGKRCLIVDDSIVRGNTALQIVKLIREAGAAQVIVVSTCPPIAYPCYYGIDFPSPAELIACGRTEDEIASVLGADGVVYQTVEGLKQALQQPGLCTGCLTGEYPTDVSDGAAFANYRNKDRARQPS